jgi:hypothetical protein
MWFFERNTGKTMAQNKTCLLREGGTPTRTPRVSVITDGLQNGMSPLRLAGSSISTFAAISNPYVSAKNAIRSAVGNLAASKKTTHG